MAREVGHGDANNVSLVWSLDGGTIGTILRDQGADTGYVVRVYEVVSGVTSSPGTLLSSDEPQIWAHNTSFRVMTTDRDDEACTIKISEVGPVITKIESFRVEPWGPCDEIETFSPTTYRVSVSARDQIRVLDVWSSECLLEGRGFGFGSHCFSSDGRLFAVSSMKRVYIWKYTPGRYTSWRDFPQNWEFFSRSPLWFSPTLSSILSCPTGALQVWRLDAPTVIAHPDSLMPLAALSCCGTYMATCHKGDSTITVANPLSQTPSQSIDTNMKIEMLALTGNVLLVRDLNNVVAWRLTEEGVVGGVLGGRTAGRSDSIWTVSVSRYATFSIEDQIVIVEYEGDVVHVYHAGTGEMLEPSRIPPGHSTRYYLWDMLRGRHYLRYYESDAQNPGPEDDWPVSWATLREGWVKDPEGKHRLWIPVEWRTRSSSAGWLYDITTLWFNRQGVTVIVMI